MGKLTVDRDAAGARRRLPVPRRRARDLPRTLAGCVAAAARRPRPRQRRHRASLGRCSRRRRRRVQLGLGRRVQPEDGSRVRGLVVPSPVVRGRRDRRCGDGAPRGRGLRIFAMDASGEADLYELDLADPVAFVFGNEAWGLPRGGGTLADATVRVPIAGARRVAEPRRRGHGVPVRVGAAAARRAACRPRDDHRGGGARHPLAADGDEGVRARARHALGADDRRSSVR